MSDQPLNPKLAAVFAIPIALVSIGLFASKKYIDVFDNQADLRKKVNRARTLGIPFTAEELRSTFSSRPENKYDVEYRTQLGEINLDELLNSDLFSAPKTLASATKIATQLASSATFADSRDFDSYDYVDVYSTPRKAAKMLVIEANRQAARGNREDAIKTLALIPNLFKQLRQDPYIMGLLVNSSMQIEMCRGISVVSARFGKDLDGQKKLLDLVDSDWSTQPLTHALKGEFYMQLGMLRNQLPTVLYWSAPSLAPGEEPKVDYSKPIQKSGLPSSTVGQGLVSRLLDYYLEVYGIFSSHSDPEECQLLIQAVAEKYDENSLGGRFVSQIAGNASSACTVYPRQKSWKAITSWVIEIHRDYNGKFPASLPPRKDPGLGGELRYKKTEAGFRVYSYGENGSEDDLSSLEKGGMDRDDFGIEVPRAP